MKLIQIPAADAARLVPLLQELHALHATQHPARYPADPTDGALTTWLCDWLAQDSMHALAAESPNGTLLGYLIYEMQRRPALPVLHPEYRAMLHHIAVASDWRRMGVGRFLIKAMKTRALADGATGIATTYAPFNHASAALMQSMGLEPVIITAEWRAPKQAEDAAGLP